MSKHRKHRESRPERQETANEPTPLPAIETRLLSRTLLWQLLTIIGLSTVLGFTFNAANPVGIRFDQPTTLPTPEVASATKISPPILTPTNTVVPAPSQPTNIAVVAAPPLPALPTEPIRPLPVALPVSNTPASMPTNPAGVATPPPVVAQPNPAPIHWPETKVLVAAGSAVLVDVRHQALFNAGHIPGATSLPEMSSLDDFKNFLARQPADKIVIVYCSSTSCSQSARVATRLVTEFHWPAVRYMTGGYAEYQQAELANPTPKSTP